MSLIGLSLNLLLAVLLAGAMLMGWRLNRRLKALRDSHDGFAVAVRELNSAAGRAEQGLADLRAATDEAADALADRIEKGRALATRLERLIDRAPPASQVPASAAVDFIQQGRLGALLAAAREARPERPERAEPQDRSDRQDRPEHPQLIDRRAASPVTRLRPNLEDDLFEDAPQSFEITRGVRP